MVYRLGQKATNLAGDPKPVPEIQPVLTTAPIPTQQTKPVKGTHPLVQSYTTKKLGQGKKKIKNYIKCTTKIY